MTFEAKRRSQGMNGCHNERGIDWRAIGEDVSFSQICPERGARVFGLDRRVGVCRWHSLFLTDRGETFGIVVLACVVLVVQLWSVVTWYYVFRVGLREVGWKYTIGRATLYSVNLPSAHWDHARAAVTREADVERLRRWEEVEKRDHRSTTRTVNGPGIGPSRSRKHEIAKSRNTETSRLLCLCRRFREVHFFRVFALSRYRDCPTKTYWPLKTDN